MGKAYFGGCVLTPLRSSLSVYLAAFLGFARLMPTWASSNLCTTSASEAKRYCLRSLSCSSRKTPESNKSVDIIDPGWSYSQRYTFSLAVRKGNWLFISGLTATDEH